MQQVRGVAVLIPVRSSLSPPSQASGRLNQRARAGAHLEGVGLGLEGAQAHGLLPVGAPAVVVGLENGLVQEQAQLRRHGG